ncbi:MAG: TerB family tellurite resistance protein [Bacteroidia bacterium]|nr:TerB family tellurite resistance protein [Bacteroidia bacterium]
MHKAKFNKDVAGYMMLLILAESDGDFDPREGSVIVDFITENFPFRSNLEAAAEEISILPKEDYGKELTRLAEDFYSESTEKERTEFLRFAMKLVRADDRIDAEEDQLITRLYDAWDL